MTSAAGGANNDGSKLAADEAGPIRCGFTIDRLDEFSVGQCGSQLKFMPYLFHVKNSILFFKETRATTDEAGSLVIQ